MNPFAPRPSLRRVLWLSPLLLLVLAFDRPGTPGMSRGQLLFVPVYSEIPFGDAATTLPLSVTVSLRNTDPARPIVVERVDYHDSRGQLVRSYLDAPQVLGPLAAQHFFLRESDRDGGVSSSFLVSWRSDDAVSPPHLDAVMLTTRSQQGISFSTSARVLRERN